MEKLLLSEIAKVLKTSCSIDKEITEISTDTRNLPKGCLFVAIKGDRFDGHEYISKAIESGAAAALSEKEVDGCPCIIVENTRKAYLELAGYYRRKFSPILVGVTGSVGKTTTKEMIALVLSEKFNCLKTKGNLNNEIGLPKTLFTMDSSHDVAVIEMGMSDFGEIERLSKAAAPTIGVITNIGFSHIENLKSQEGILKAKLEILNGMAENAPLVVNGDDDYISPLKENLSVDRHVYLFGIDNENSDFRATDINEDNGITTFNINYSGKVCSAEIPCIGRHNVLNALAAFCIGMLSGLAESEILSALKKYQPDAMRQNIVKKGENTVIIDCYNASPESMKASLGVLSQMKSDGRKIAVLGDILELGSANEKLHRLVGKYVCDSKPDMLFCFGKDSKFIKKEAEFFGIESYFTSDKQELTKKISSYIKDGDTILFKASRGMKLEEVIENVFNQEGKPWHIG